MRFANRHATMAKALARREGGVTARELAKAIKRSERLANAIIRAVLSDGGFWLKRRSWPVKPGPPPLALAAIEETRKEVSNGTNRN